MASGQLRATVVGGGIGGLATARALFRSGVDVNLYEQAPALTEVGAGVGITPNATRLLFRAGLKAATDAVACHWTYGEICGPDDNVIGTIPYEYWGFHRADLIDILRADLPDDVVHTGMRCVDFTQTEDEARVSFDSGDEVVSDIVVAADGLHSGLQKWVVPPSPPLFAGTVAYRGVVSSHDMGPKQPHFPVHWVAGGGRHIITFPVRRGELVTYIGFLPTTDQARESWSASAVASDFAHHFTGWNPRLDSILEAITPTDTFRWTLYDRLPLARWTSGRLTLLGDAAHPMLPHAGQGANQAIEDAFALAFLVKDAEARTAPAALLDYERLRRERTATMQENSRGAGARFKAAGSNLGPGKSGAPKAQMAPSFVFDFDVEAAAQSLMDEAAR